MSKDKYGMTRKRFEKLMAGRHNMQVREAHDMVMNDVVNPVKRMQEEHQTAKHQKLAESGAKRA